MSTPFAAALYARVSTEDRQSPTDSIAWQRALATSLIAAQGGRIVAEYLDVGVSRSLPWPRRPEAARLLADCARRDRAFGAIVIGEPQRAFAGAQFALTFPLFVHHGVELWVPEVGGRIDPDSEAHDLVMSLFGGLSKAERSRIQRRVKAAMTTMAHAGGRYLGGRPPYGYHLAPIATHPNAEKARVGATLNRLEPDPVTAPIVERIFTERLAGAGYSSIARNLNHDGIPSPAAADPARNSHRDPRGWAASAVRAILMNARYTGHEVWNRQRRDYELIDVNHVAEGHVRRMRWNPPDQWIWSPEPTHDAAHRPRRLATRPSTHHDPGTRRSPHRRPLPPPRTCVLRHLRSADDRPTPSPPPHLLPLRTAARPTRTHDRRPSRRRLRPRRHTHPGPRPLARATLRTRTRARDRPAHRHRGHDNPATTPPREKRASDSTARASDSPNTATPSTKAPTRPPSPAGSPKPPNKNEQPPATSKQPPPTRPDPSPSTTYSPPSPSSAPSQACSRPRSRTTEPSSTRRSASPPPTTRPLEPQCWRPLYRVAQKTCRRGDLNPHALSGTRPST